MTRVAASLSPYHHDQLLSRTRPLLAVTHDPTGSRSGKSDCPSTDLALRMARSAYSLICSRSVADCAKSVAASMDMQHANASLNSGGILLGSVTLKTYFNHTSSDEHAILLSSTLCSTRPVPESLSCTIMTLTKSAGSE